MTTCITQPDGLNCPAPSDWATCRPWDLTAENNTSCYADSLTQDALEIAGAKVNVYKLLGVHEQTRLVDLIGDGTALSGGDAVNYPASNAFTTHANEWRSVQVGSAAVSASAYIGYDFGILRLPNGRQRYGIEAPVRQHVTAIKIKQSSNPLRRVAKVRVERSDNGTQWFGVAVLTLPNDDVLNQLYFKASVPSRYWRIRPVGFVGTDCDSWGVQALEMYDYTLTDVSNIQDMVLMENRDRSYANTPVLLKGYYELLSVSTDFSRFGLEIPTSTYQIRVNFNACVAALGRPVVIGDIIELPSETQYSATLQPIKRWLEVTDVTWDASSYTPGWVPTMLMITTQPAMATQETQDIFGDLARSVDSSGLFSTDDGNNKMYQDFSNISQTVAAEALSQVPEQGSEGSNVIREFTPTELDAAAKTGAPHLNHLGFNRTGLYVEDAIPQNGAPYTEGNVYPTNPKDGDYHRMTYTGLAEKIPARLFRWSTKKGRWVFLEQDKREQFNADKPRLQEYTTSPYKKWASEIK